MNAERPHLIHDAAGAYPVAYTHEACGPGAIAQAVRDALATPGRVVRLAVADHPGDGGTIRRLYTLAVGTIEGRRCLRYVGTDGTPDGECSSSVIPSWNGAQAMDPAELAAVIAFSAGRHGAWVFRLPDPE